MARIVVDSLSKSFSGVTVIDNISFQMDTGLMGLLGPNASGKTTLLRLLATIIKPTKGTLKWMGVDCIQDPLFIKENLGYLPQSFGLFPEMKAIDFIVYISSLKGIPSEEARKRGATILEKVNIDPKDNRPLKTFSTGMRRRIGIAQALIGDPKLLLLDEPTVALDPEERIHILELIADFAKTRTVIMATHIPQDLQRASYIAILQKGKLGFFDTPERLIDMVRGKVWKATGKSEFIHSLSSELIQIRYDTPPLAHALVISDTPPCYGAELIEPSLEDSYIAFMTEKGII